MIVYSTECFDFACVLLATQDDEIVFLGLFEGECSDSLAWADLKCMYPNDEFIERQTILHKEVFAYLHHIGSQEIRHFPMRLKGTVFEQSVWQALMTIPPQSFASYKDIAIKIGKPKAFRAVGNAISKNPISILIPCHRVIAHQGGIGGYHWGLDIKKALLTAEGYDLSCLKKHAS
ncbi:methylated-DNA--[protein]-cysteine S-methyltransferase [Basilea psittacipulmonis]|uniref:methylated-DNA--[protein]-cysteine S-methyltransferase n=1 Tax=Basilea psittacipulmonis TaxID=1472345 RepID=UPI00068DA0B2|nr:methylated-DNA--[protein]-cysteine S-methyltransferase [Basilea psittacipulmonis]